MVVVVRVTCVPIGDSGVERNGPKGFGELRVSWQMGPGGLALTLKAQGQIKPRQHTNTRITKYSR